MFLQQSLGILLLCFGFFLYFSLLAQCRIFYLFQPLKEFLDHDLVILQISNYSHKLYQQAIPILIQATANISPTQWA